MVPDERREHPSDGLLGASAAGAGALPLGAYAGPAATGVAATAVLFWLLAFLWAVA